MSNSLQQKILKNGAEGACVSTGDPSDARQ